MAGPQPIHARYLAPASPGEMGLLFSFHYLEGRSVADYVATLGYRPEVFIDSGGFSAFTQGATISIADYSSWLRRNLHAIDHYANLDVIGDPRGTLQNQLRLEALGLRPLPIIHYGTPAEEISRYAKKGYSYACLGGLVPHLGSLSQALRSNDDHPGLVWLRKCHEVAAAEGVGLHGFGATSWSLLRAFPWRSVDSSTWSTSVRYGRLPVFDPGAGRWVTTPIRDVQGVMRLGPVLRSYGVEPLEILRDMEHTRRLTVLVSARSWLVASRWLRERGHAPQVFIVSPSGSFGTTDPELRNAFRISAGAHHQNGIISEVSS